jgi:integrase
MSVWTAAGKGIRYKEHPSRKHGKRPDRYWCIQYKLHGRNINEAVGWWSDGITQSHCEELIASLRINQKNGQGPQTLREMREFNKDRREKEAVAKATARNRTLGGFFEIEYLPRIELNQGSITIAQKKRLIKTWLAPLADKPLRDITSTDLENQVLRSMLQAGKSPATIRHALSLVSTIWNMAQELGIVSGENPSARVKKPKRDNQRDRFLSHSEAAVLLKILAESSPVTHDVTLLSLFSGLRVGECLKLTWADINFEAGDIFVKDTKNTRNRHAHFTAEIREMLLRRHQSRTDGGCVFPQSSFSQIYTHVGKYFRLATNELGLYKGVTESRQKAVIHSFRHTFASWLVQKGTPLYTVSKLLVHSSIKMTERYAHLAPDTQRAAVMDLEGILKGK